MQHLSKQDSPSPRVLGTSDRELFIQGQEQFQDNPLNENL